jgi:hypothetical protein
MNKEAPGDGRVAGGGRLPYRVGLPGFVTDEEIGLGDIVKRVASVAGLRPCGSCNPRADALNRRLVFAGRRPR